MAGIAGRRTTRRCREGSPRRDRHTSMPATASETFDEPVAGLGVVEGLAAAVVEGNTAGRLEGGTAQFDKTAQRMMVRLGLLKWGLGMYSHLLLHLHHHPSLAAPPVRPGHGPDGGASCPRRQVGVGQRRRAGIRSNGDA